MSVELTPEDPARNPEPATKRGRLRRWAVIQFGLVAVPVLVAVLLLRGHDATGLFGAVRTGPAAAPDPMPRLLIALPAVWLACQLCAVLFRRLGQPPVVGEMLAGLLLGPSALGYVWPSGYHWLFPDYLSTPLNVLAQLGLVLFMSLVGYEIDLSAVRRHRGTVISVSQVSMVVPFAAGIGLAVGLYGTFGTKTVPFPVFALFLGIATSVTAFPVLARLLVDRGYEKTTVGTIALSCAAVNDVVAWLLLALVSVLASGSSVLGQLRTVALLAVFVLVLVGVVRPVLRRAAARTAARDDPAMRPGIVLAAVLSAVSLSALATQALGLHPIFGAFLLGAVVPRGWVPVRQAIAQMRGFVATALLPLFFVYTGLHTQIGLLGGSWQPWLWSAVVLLVAMIGKWPASTAAARVAGLDRRDALALGCLMNCRGLTELIVLNVGLGLGLITPTVFTMFVLMALVSTMLTAPIFDRLNKGGRTWTGSAPGANT